MKKIILSAVVTAMALTTTASALEDIKVNGQAKLWYESNNAGDSSLMNKDGATAEVTFKLGVTGKQGNIGFGTTIYQASTMGIEGIVVKAGGVRTPTSNEDMYVGEAYITAPMGSKTLLKFGKQELDTPLAFTERWHSAPNTFNAAVAINNSINNVTLIGAYVGQTSNMNHATTGTPTIQMGAGNGVYAAGALYKNDALAVNVWAYEISSVAKAIWVDAAMKVGPVALKGYASMMAPAADNTDAGTALALSVAMKAGSVKLFAAASTVSDDDASFGNTGTGGKKTKLPTMGVYTDGKYVAIAGSTAFKLKAATKVAGVGMALQGVMNSNEDANLGGGGDSAIEFDYIASKKFGDFNMKAILMHRDWDANKDAQQHVRIIASVNF